MELWTQPLLPKRMATLAGIYAELFEQCSSAPSAWCGAEEGSGTKRRRAAHDADGAPRARRSIDVTLSLGERIGNACALNAAPICRRKRRGPTARPGRMSGAPESGESRCTRAASGRRSVPHGAAPPPPPPPAAGPARGFTLATDHRCPPARSRPQPRGQPLPPAQRHPPEARKYLPQLPHTPLPPPNTSPPPTSPYPHRHRGAIHGLHQAPDRPRAPPRFAAARRRRPHLPRPSRRHDHPPRAPRRARRRRGRRPRGAALRLSPRRRRLAGDGAGAAGRRADRRAAAAAAPGRAAAGDSAAGGRRRAARCVLYCVWSRVACVQGRAHSWVFAGPGGARRCAGAAGRVPGPLLPRDLRGAREQGAPPRRRFPHQPSAHPKP